MGILLDSLRTYVAERDADRAAAKRPKSGFVGEIGATARDILSDTEDAVGTITGSSGLVDAAERGRRASARTRNNSTLTQSWDDVHGVGDFAGFLEKGVASTIPTLATLAVGGLAGRAIGGGLRLAEGGYAARAAESAGALAPTELAAIGNKFKQQRDQGGETDFVSAAVLGTVDNALNLVGEGRLAIGGLGKSLAASRLKRVALVGGKTAAEEGLAEVGQQFTEELARKSVDQNYDLLNPEAQARYKESAIAGALLGGVIGGGVTGLTPGPRSASPKTPRATNDGDPKEILALPTTPVDPSGPADGPGNGSDAGSDAGARPNPRDVTEDFFTGETLEEIRPARAEGIVAAIRGEGTLDKYHLELANTLSRTLSRHDPEAAAAHVEKLTDKLSTNLTLSKESRERRAASLDTATDIITAYALRHDAVSRDIHTAKQEKQDRDQSEKLDAYAQRGLAQAKPGATVGTGPDTSGAEQQIREQNAKAEADMQARRQAVLQDAIASASGKDPRASLMRKMNVAMKPVGGDINPSQEEYYTLEQAIRDAQAAKIRAMTGNILDAHMEQATREQEVRAKEKEQETPELHVPERKPKARLAPTTRVEEPVKTGQLSLLPKELERQASPLGTTKVARLKKAQAVEAETFPQGPVDQPQLAGPLKRPNNALNYQRELFTARGEPTKSAKGLSVETAEFRAREAKEQIRSVPQKAVIALLERAMKADSRFSGSVGLRVVQAVREHKLPVARRLLEAEKQRLFNLDKDKPVARSPAQDVRDALGAHVRDNPEQFSGATQEKVISHLEGGRIEEARAELVKDKERIAALDAKGGISPETKKVPGPKVRGKVLKENYAPAKAAEPVAKTQALPKESIAHLPVNTLSSFISNGLERKHVTTSEAMELHEQVNSGDPARIYDAQKLLLERARSQENPSPAPADDRSTQEFDDNEDFTSLSPGKPQPGRGRGVALDPSVFKYEVGEARARSATPEQKTALDQLEKLVDSDPMMSRESAENILAAIEAGKIVEARKTISYEEMKNHDLHQINMRASESSNVLAKFAGIREALISHIRYNPGTYSKSLVSRMEPLLRDGHYKAAEGLIQADKENIQVERVRSREEKRLAAQDLRRASEKSRNESTAESPGKHIVDRNYRRDNYNPRTPENLARIARAHTIVQGIVRGWANLPKIEVFDSRAPTNDAQAYILDELKGHEIAPRVGTKGAFYVFDGKPHIALLVDYNDSPADFLATLYHELLGHYGLRDKFGADLTRMARDAYMTSPLLQKEMDARSSKDPSGSWIDVDPRRYHFEEILAEKMEQGLLPQGIVSRVKGLLRFYARKVGYIKSAWTTDEIATVLRAAQKQVVRSGGPLGGKGIFSKGAPKNYEEMTSLRPDAPAATPSTPSSAPSSTPIVTRSERIRKTMEARGAPSWLVSAVNTWDDKGRMVAQGMMSGNGLVKYAIKQGLPDYARYNALRENMEATANGYTKRLDQILIQATRLPETQLAELNSYLKSATIAGEWGFQPAWRTDSVPIDPRAKAAYDALTPEQQSSAKEIFQYAHDSRTELQKVVHDYIRGEADADIKGSLNKAEIQEVQERRARQLKLFDKSVPKLVGPYAPLMRFGNHVAVAKSQELIDLEKKTDKSAEEKAELASLLVDPDHLTVLFRDTAGIADQAAGDLKGTGAYGQVYSSTRTEFYNQIGESPLMQMQKLKELVSNQLGKVDNSDRLTTRKIDALLKDLYVSTLADNSARKHDTRRKNISGADDNMLRAVATKGRADAHYLSQMKNRHELNTVLRTLTEKANVKDEKIQERKSLINEIIARHTAAMEHDETPWQDKAMAISSAWHLATSPRYYLQNLTQPAMVSIPLMAGRHGYARAWRALISSYSVLSPHVSTRDFWAGKIDLKAFNLPADETEMLKYAQDHNLLDVGMAYDAGHWDATSKGSKYAAEITHFFRTKSGQVEVINRVSSSLAAFRLAKEDGSTSEQAQASAMAILNDTQFNYSKLNAPRYFNKVYKPVSQFRKYQIYQLALVGRLLMSSTLGSNVEEKYVARKALGYMFAQLGVVSGAVGLPGAQLAGVLGSALFGDEDEPLDGERWLERAFGSSDTARTLLRGVPTAAGLEMSGLGLGTLLNPIPFADYTQLDTEAGLEKTVFSALGPVGGVAQKFVRAARSLENGDYLRAAVDGAPSGVSYALKAYSQSQRGLTKRNGDQLLSPEEISYTNEVLQALGFPPTVVLNAQRLTSQAHEFDQYFKSRTAQIKFAYTQALKAGDTDTAQGAKASWDALQTAKRHSGIQVSPLGDLLRAPAEQRKRERATLKGVQYRQNNKGFVEGAEAQ